MTTRRNFLTSSVFAGLGATLATRTLADSHAFVPAGPAADLTQSTLDMLDPAYHEFVQGFGTLDITDDSLAQIREGLNGAQVSQELPDVAEVFDMPESTASFRLFRPETAADGPVPAIIYIHGGGMVLGQASSSDTFCHLAAQQTGAVVANVEYRLAPNAPFPGPVEDCHDVLAYVFNNAESLGIDPARISVMGHSAGGGLAAALAILARDRGEVPIKSQILIYPMLDYRTGTTAAPVNNMMTGEFVWTRANNRFGWTSLRGNYALDEERIGQFSPSHVPSTAGLPPAFIAVGTLDLFMDEDAAYALRLTHARVPTEFHLYPGAMHAFDAIPTATPAAAFYDDLAKAYKRLL